MSLLNLPTEILVYIFSYVDGKDIATLRRTSAFFKSITDGNDFLWNVICKNKFDIAGVSISSLLRYEDLYKHILHKYGLLVGTWIMALPPYGGLAKIIFTDNGMKCYRLKEPTNVDKGFNCEPLLTICLDSLNNVMINCLKGYHGPHDTDIEIQSCDHIILKCKDSDKHRHPDGRENELIDLINNETGTTQYVFAFPGDNLLLRKIFKLLSFETCFHMNRFIPPTFNTDYIIQPGMFKGSYGGHGVEIVCLEYSANLEEANITKLTGDPNVPAGEITIKADLLRPMILDKIQQSSLETLEDIDLPLIPPGMTIKTLPLQPFVIPPDCIDRETPLSQTFRHCKARFHSKGQIAGHGFVDPSFIPGHWIIFNENTFGHIWLQLRSFSIFIRIDDI